MRRRSCLPSVAATALCLLVLRSASASPPLAPPGPTVESVASAWIRAGQHIDAERWQEAKTELADIMAVAPRWDVAANLGAAELQLGDAAGAAKHLRFARDNMPADVGTEARAWLEAQLAQAEQLASAGSVQPSSVQPSSAEPSSLRPSSAASAPTDPTRTALLVAGSALAVAGFAVGAGLLGASRSRDSQARVRAESLTTLGGDCTTQPLVCEEIGRHQDARDALTGGAIAGLAAGALFTAATLAYAFVADDSTEPAILVMPQVGHSAEIGQSAGVALRWRW